MRINAYGVVSELAASQHNVFTRRQAAPLGIRRDHIASLLRAGLAVEMASGGLALLHGAERPSWRQRVAGAVSDHPGVVASHTTAARLDGVDGFDGYAEIELSVLRPRSLRIPGVTVHRVGALDRIDLHPIDGISSTNRARTLCDLGQSVEPLMVERALFDAVRRKVNERWVLDTLRRLHRPGQLGTGVLGDAIEELRKKGRAPESWFERLVELCLDDPVLGEVVRQFELHDDAGRHVARFDLAIPEVKLGIEAHSKQHHFSEEEVESDEHRDQRAGEHGWDIVYLGYAAVESPSTVARRVRRRVEVRRQQFGSGA